MNIILVILLQMEVVIMNTQNADSERLEYVRCQRERRNKTHKKHSKGTGFLVQSIIAVFLLIGFVLVKNNVIPLNIFSLENLKAAYVSIVDNTSSFKLGDVNEKIMDTINSNDTLRAVFNTTTGDGTEGNNAVLVNNTAEETTSDVPVNDTTDKKTSDVPVSDKIDDTKVDATVEASNTASGGQDIFSVSGSNEKLVNWDNVTEKQLVIPCSGEITSRFGERVNPISGIEGFHYGLDIANTEGSNIYAVADGVVTFSGYSTVFGRYIEIEHSDGLKSLYAHCQRIDIKSGNNVTTGQRIAVMGSTGLSTGSHLHLELKKNDKYVDPEQYYDVYVKD